MVEVRVEARPPGPFLLPRHGVADGAMRRRAGGLWRLVHCGCEPVVVSVVQPERSRVIFQARARTRAAAEHGVERMRFALGVDVDVAPFLRSFRSDPAIGYSLRTRAGLRVLRRPEPFEALAWAVCEQLIEYRRAAAIERRIVRRIGRSLLDRRCGLLHDCPTPSALAGVAPALLQSFDLAGSRAQALVRCAREVAAGRVDLHGPDHERGWRRLRAIPGIGSWTVEMLALHGQGREEVVPAGDVGLLRAVGHRLSGGDPRAYATEQEVRSFFCAYGPWAGLAAAHMLSP